MKRIVFSILAAGLVITNSCTDKNEFNSIKMTVSCEVPLSSVMICMAGSGTFTINWGDGLDSKKTYTLAEYNEEDWNDRDIGDKYMFKRDYTAGKSSCTITITGENITHFFFANGQLDVVGVPNYVAPVVLTSLDVTKNTALTWLHCSSNKLTSLDVSNNAALTYLSCDGNQFTNLNVSQNTVLTLLYCNGNKLTSLDVSNNTALANLYCAGNQLTDSALNALFGTLHSNVGEKSIIIRGNPGATSCDKSIAMNKGWEIRE